MIEKLLINYYYQSTIHDGRPVGIINSYCHHIISPHSIQKARLCRQSDILCKSMLLVYATVCMENEQDETNHLDLLCSLGKTYLQSYTMYIFSF